MNEATRRQVEAADPARSTWLSANAGSGKTRVLTDRVARLLLAGTPPENILCLTYTKAAAGEMQNRLFEQLGAWAMLPDPDLRTRLADKGVPPADLTPDSLDAARRLFAGAIEAPGGLKIQTIHAFCAALLRQFPLEAQVAPGFTELDETSAARLHDDVLEAMAEGPQAAVIDGVARYVGSDETLAALARQVLSQRDAFETPLTLPGALCAHGLPNDFDEARLLDEVLVGGEDALVTRIAPELLAKGGDDSKLAEKLQGAFDGPASIETLDALETALLFGAKTKAPFAAKIGTIPTKATRAKLEPADLDALNDLMRRVEAARPRRLALASVRRTAALHRFAGAFLQRVAREKERRGVLDFDDLILRARALLQTSAVGDWVLYKLDGGIDHVLVDEAQDTSPAQWQVIRLLANEIIAGAGARDGTARTIFVVGDKKQSIYSFQGADPGAFDRLRTDFASQLAAGAGLADGELLHSFRSAPAILESVDATFAEASTDAIGPPPQHNAFHGGLPGRVDLWPWVLPPERPEAPDWFEPVDQISPQSPHAVLADAIAGELRRLIDAGETVPVAQDQCEALHEGHVLILVQRRGTLFRQIIRACKARNLAIAGADRLKLTQDLAVQDLLALLAFVALPEDDLSLACALRSPLFGWSEDDLYRLAQPRKGYLWEALRRNHDGTRTYRILRDLRDRSDFLRPYDLLERMLTAHGGRTSLLARLGPDCEEPIDALLEEALVYEQADVPSLTGFMEWMSADEREIKRREDAGGRRLRVMTVHGAKGLEAEVVILPDCGVRRPQTAPEILHTAGGWAAWKGQADAMPAQVADANTAWKAAQEAERQRLLYVAMTRAKSWLWVCACGEEDKNGASWHAQVRRGLEACGAQACRLPTGEGLRFASNDWHAVPLAPAPAKASARPPLPGWIDELPSALPPRSATVTPSDLGGAKVLPGEGGAGDEEAALRRGRQIHLLLERLPDYPEASWASVTPGLLAMSDDPADIATATDLLEEATRVLTNPALKPVFSSQTLAEVAVSAPLPDGRRLAGVIDRLIITPEMVKAVDFKTNAVVPLNAGEIPEGLLRQMGAYRTALATIYPDRVIETALLWTRTGQLTEVPAAGAEAAWKAAVLDASAADT